eukprot:Filipodium_phascolosomae@DN2649_c0_g1_i5.p1
MCAPTDEALKAIRRTWGYLKSSQAELPMKHTNEDIYYLRLYSDASYSSDSAKAVRGGIITIGGASRISESLLHWFSRSQKRKTAKSSTGAELLALVDGTNILIQIWDIISRCLKDVKIQIYIDSQPLQYQLMERHGNADYKLTPEFKWILEAIEDLKAEILWLSGKEIPADELR